MASKKYRVAVLDHTINTPDVEEGVLGSIAAPFVPHRKMQSSEDLIDFCRDADAIITASLMRIGAKEMDSLPRLRIISSMGTGYDNIDVEAATQRGIAASNVPDYASNEVADHAMALILSLARRVPMLDRMLRSGIWGDRIPDIMPIRAFSSQVLGLVAFGRIARRVARRAQPFGFKVIAYDPYVPRWDFELLGVEKVETLNELMERSDIVSAHLPLNEETRGLIGRQEIGAMKRGASLVNTGRGRTIDEAALAAALESGRLGGAALDVFETEPVDLSNPLFRMENVVVTPHVAGYSDATIVKCRLEAARTVAEVLRGRQPRFILNPEVFAKKG